MRRPLIVTSTLLACLALLPARLAWAGAPSSVAIAPAIETLEVANAIAPSATVRDEAGAAVSGVQVDWRVVDGGHAIDDLDGNELTPAGVVGVCMTNDSGFCSVSYTGTRVTVDTLRALVDLDHDGVAEAGEPVATASVDWRATGGGPSKVRLDMSGCDGDLTAPVDEATWNDAVAAGEVGGIRTVCAARFASADAPAAGPVTFTIIGGPGVFTDASGADDFGTQIVVDAAGGSNTARIRSIGSGTTTVRAAFAAVTASGTAVWTPGAARIVTAAGPSSPASGTTRDVLATVTDRYGNPVPGVDVVFTEDGVGVFAAGQPSVTATTGPAGTAAAAVRTDPGQVGGQTVTAAIAAGATDCERAAGDPVGAPAGVCRADASLQWIEASPALSLDVTPPIGVWGTQFAIAGTLQAGSSPISGKSILVYARPVGTGPESWSPIAVAVTDETGVWAASQTPSLHTEYRAAFPGDDGYAAALSGTDRADVRVGLHLNQSTASLRAGATVTFTGRVLPEHPNHPVYLQQLTGAGWRTIATTRTGGNSWYQFRVAKRTPGGLLFRTVTPSDFHHAWNASLNRRVDWR